MDQEAEVFRELYPGLRRLAAVVGSMDIDPDDLVQEAVTRALSRGSLTDLDNPRAYLCRTIVNLASNNRRSFRRWRSAVDRHGADASQNDIYPSDLAALLQLAHQDRALLFLVHIEGASFAEAAAAIGCAESAARKRASRARARLRRLAGDEP